jgi:putative transposase
MPGNGNGSNGPFCVETLEDALARHGKPDIFNTDQGSQFTGSAFTGVLIENGIAIKRLIGRRPHSSLDGTTPDQAYFTPLPIRMAA